MDRRRKLLIAGLVSAGTILVLVGLTATAFTTGNLGSVSFIHAKPLASGSSAKASPQKSPGAPGSSPTAHPATPAPTMSPNQATYKVTGTVTLSPSSPVCSASKPCTSPVANHEIDIVGPIPVKTRTNAQGQFSLNLPNGHYLMTLNPAVGPGAQSWPFTIAGQPLSLPITADSGIR